MSLSAILNSPPRTRLSSEISDCVWRDTRETRHGSAVLPPPECGEGGAERLAQCLAHRQPGVLDGVVLVDVQVALAVNIQVDQAVAGDLVEHVLQEGHADGEARLAGAIEIDGDLDLGFQGVALYASRTFGHQQLR